MRTAVRRASMAFTWAALIYGWWVALVHIQGCAPVEPVDPKPPGPDAGCEEIESGSDACGIAARHIVCELGCEGWRPAGIDRVPGTPDDEPYAYACRLTDPSTTCLASAETCEQAERCE